MEDKNVENQIEFFYILLALHDWRILLDFAENERNCLGQIDDSFGETDTRFFSSAATVHDVFGPQKSFFLQYCAQTALLRASCRAAGMKRLLPRYQRQVADVKKNEPGMVGLL